MAVEERCSSESQAFFFAEACELRDAWAHDRGEARSWKCHAFLCHSPFRCLFSELCWLTSPCNQCLFFSLSLSRPLSLCEWRGRGRNKGMAWFLSSFTLTFASWTLHQQKSGTIRKRKQWQGNWKHPWPPSLCPKHINALRYIWRTEEISLEQLDLEVESLLPHLPWFYGSKHPIYIWISLNMVAKMGYETPK